MIKNTVNFVESRDFRVIRGSDLSGSSENGRFMTKNAVNLLESRDFRVIQMGAPRTSRNSSEDDSEKFRRNSIPEGVKRGHSGISPKEAPENSGEIPENLTKRTKAHEGAQRRTKAHKGAQMRTKAHKGAQRRTKAHKGAQRRAKARKGAQERTRARETRQNARFWMKLAK
jgi:hypothetical protein